MLHCTEESSAPVIVEQQILHQGNRGVSLLMARVKSFSPLAEKNLNNRILFG